MRGICCDRFWTGFRLLLAPLDDTLFSLFTNPFPPRPNNEKPTRYEAIERAYPCVCTPSVKAGCAKTFPSQIVPGLLYLGVGLGLIALNGV